MENNFISTSMDVKLDIHDKRPDSLKFKTWTRCQVKIEAIKCLPCFLRVSLKRENSDNPAENKEFEEQSFFNVSINVPGVTVSPATSRTKQHSYGLFWTQNRRDCFIYFGLETELNCRRYMKWIKKSIKKLELHRQVFLEQRRNSRGPGKIGVIKKDFTTEMEIKTDELNQCFYQSTSRSLPKIPDLDETVNNSWKSPQFISRASEIYEEICENVGEVDKTSGLSRRLSRSSITSGIYEEMKPTASNFIVIDEEPPPLPPLPPQRKRINTFEMENAVQPLGDIPRCNTNPESELAKKKKYKTMLDNLFGGVRSKRSESVSEGQVCTADEVINCVTPKQKQPQLQKHYQELGTKAVNFSNNVISSKRQKKSVKFNAKSKRNSFSSPDLSKINFFDTFDEDKVVEFLNNSFSNKEEDLDLSIASLDESSILHEPKELNTRLSHVKFNSKESLNLSAKIPSNFNFSACNSSTINLIGASGASLWQATTMTMVKKNKIFVEDLTGYCIMQPITKKTQSIDNKINIELLKNVKPTTSSDHLAESHSSFVITSANAIKNEQNLTENVESSVEKATVNINSKSQSINEDSTIYENMHAADSNSGSMIDGSMKETAPNANAAIDFPENFYENLIQLKAKTHLLEQSPADGTISTSTPTESPHAQEVLIPKIVKADEETEESFYQTPRKSIISVDEKIPSYYPNSCDTMKMRRSPPIKATTSNKSFNEKSHHNSSGNFHKFSSVRMRHERKENLYISSPQKIIDQRQNATKSESQKPKNIYMSTHFNKKSIIKSFNHHNNYNNNNNNHNNNNNNNNNDKHTNRDFNEEIMKEKLQKELLQLAFLQKIDFKFDDTKNPNDIQLTTNSETSLTTTITTVNSTIEGTTSTETTSKETTTINNLVSITPTSSKVTPQRSTRPVNRQHHLQVNQDANTSEIKTPDKSVKKSANIKLTPPSLSVLSSGGSSTSQLTGVKKFTSLPRFKKIDFSPLKLKINNVLQRNQHNHNQEF